MYWQVIGTNIRILGSMHLLPANNCGLPAWATQAFEWAEALVLESDPPTILPLLRSPTAVDLQTQLSPVTWARIHDLWPTSSPLPPLKAVRPWAALFLATVLTQRTAAGIEGQFIQWASEQSKPVEFLETAEEVVAAFESAPLLEVHQGLELLASDLSAPQRSLEAMYAAWLRGDLAALYNVAAQSPLFRFEGLRAAVLQRRNQAWAPALSKLLQSPLRTLVAVGALHLHGSGNAIEYLGQHVQLIPPGG
ncbi:hypothetical protein B0E51_14170 [Rhodanobacter sp. C05]|nr:hypothetical protein B0E51_14170 [Rhodanobacter sp. C05]